MPAELGLDMMHGATLGIAPIPFLESGAGVFIAMVYANILFMVSAGSHAAPCIMTRGTAAPWFTQLVYNRRFEATNWNVGADYALSLLAVCTPFILLMMRISKVSLKGIVK